MSDLVITKVDDVYMQIASEAGIAHEISDFFTFEVPGHRFMPTYRARQWDGKIRLFNVFGGQLYMGLLPYVQEFAKRRGYRTDIASDVLVNNNISEKQVKKFMDDLEFTAQGKKIEARDYQIQAVHHAIKTNRSLLLSPTSSGKSLMIYSLVRWYEDILPTNKKILIIVPTTSLVEQLYSDFADYSTKNGWDTPSNCHRIYSGAEKQTDKKVIISTWQSIYKMGKVWFEQFGTLIGDEAHGFKSKSLTSICSKLIDCPYKFGTTGTLDGTTTHKLVLEGLFGPILKVVTTKELMDSDTIAQLKIEAIALKYPESECKHVKVMSYQDEIKFLISHPRRNKFIVDLALSRTTNTLVLFQFIKHGKELLAAMKKREPDRPIFFVSGEVKVDVRESIREITERSTNAIIVASYGTYSTGINIRNLHNIVFGHPSKSRIRNLQSVGRGLRKAEGKDKAYLFDIADDMHLKKYKNYALKHFLERVKVYDSEKFDYILRSIKI